MTCKNCGWDVNLWNRRLEEVRNQTLKDVEKIVNWLPCGNADHLDKKDCKSDFVWCLIVTDDLKEEIKNLKVKNE